MEVIEQQLEELKDIENFGDKLENMKLIKSLISEEQNKIDNYIKELNNLEPVNNKKYKKYSITELEDLFENTKDLKKKIKIYSQMIYNVKELESELFDEIESSDSEM